MRVLVTGAAGYIGYAVGRRLVDDGHNVAGLVRRSGQTGKVPGGVVPVVADLLDPGNLRAALTTVIRAELGGPVEGVCHLAALARVRESFTEPLRFFATNVHGTVNLLQALPESARIVLGSTAAVYGTPDAQPIREAQQPAPTSPYGASKLAAEEALRYHVLRGRDQTAAGATAEAADPAGSIVLRTFNVAGAVDGRPDPDETRLIPRALRVAAGRLPHLDINGDGTAVREYLHVEDLAAAYVRALEALETDLVGEHRIYNVGSGTGTSVRDVVDMVGEVTKRRVATVSGPPRAEPPVLMADSSAIRDDLGWTPERSGLRQIISDSWAALHSAASIG
jgi:UDP-glucose 4-epimerase